MEKVRFSALELDLESTQGTLRDDGFVEDLDIHFDEVVGRLQACGAQEIFPYSRPDENTNGKYLCATFPERIPEYVIFYERTGNEDLDFLIRSHEETHVLHKLNLFHVLVDQMHSDGVFIPGLKRYARSFNCDDEYIAHIGGMYNLYLRRGKRVESTHPSFSKPLHDFSKANESFLKPVYKKFFSALHMVHSQSREEKERFQIGFIR